MNETNTYEQRNESPSVNLTHSVRSIWTSIGQLNEAMSAMAGENKELQMRAGEIEKLWKKYNEIKQNLPVLEEKAAISDNLVAENTRLKIENNVLQTELAELKEIEKNFGLSQQEFISKNKILAENADVINKLKEEIAGYESKIFDLTKQIDDFKPDEVKEKFEMIIADLEAMSLKDLSDSEEKSKKDIAELKSLYDNEIIELESRYENEIHKLSSEKKDLELKYSEIQENSSAQERMLNEYSQKLFDLNKNKAEFEKSSIEIEDIRKQYEVKSLKLEEQASELKRLNSLALVQTEKIQNLSDELNKYETEFWEAEDEKHELKAKIQEMLKFKEDNIDKIRRFDACMERLEFLDRVLETKSKEIESLKSKLDFSNNNINELKTILKIKDNDIILLSEFKDQQLIIAEENKMLKEGLKELKTNLEALMNDKGILVSKIIDSENQMIVLINEKNELNDNINKLTEELQQKNESILKIENHSNQEPNGFNLGIESNEKEALINLLDSYINKLEEFIDN